MQSPSGPALGRAKLLRVLALPDEADRATIRNATARLRTWLEERLVELPTEAVEERAARIQEIVDLGASAAYWTSDPARAEQPDAMDRLAALSPAILLLCGLALLALLVAYTAGIRLTREAPGEPPAIFGAHAQIFLDGSLEGATLRVLDGDRNEVLAKRPAQGAGLELEPGRYALEVSREDCPDSWTRSVYLEPDSVHRYEPKICAGQGHLVVHANTRDDRLRIDGLDVGPTGDRPHRLAVGDHTVRVEKAGFRVFEARVRIAPDESVELRAELPRLSGADAEAEAKAGRPIPVTRMAPSAPPVDAKSVQPFTKEELDAALKPPPLDPPDLGLPRRGDFLAREGLPAMPDGGSTAWHDRVSKDLRERYDRDGSGEIDRLDESEAISCSVWREIERDFDRGGLGLSLAHYYGFDGSEWHPGALAVARGHRSAVYAKMQECGLAP